MEDQGGIRPPAGPVPRGQDPRGKISELAPLGVFPRMSSDSTPSDVYRVFSVLELLLHWRVYQQGKQGLACCVAWLGVPQAPASDKQHVRYFYHHLHCCTSQLPVSAPVAPRPMAAAAPAVRKDCSRSATIWSMHALELAVFVDCRQSARVLWHSIMLIEQMPRSCLTTILLMLCCCPADPASKPCVADAEGPQAGGGLAEAAR
jgi:hypothetical protein